MPEPAPTVDLEVPRCALAIGAHPDDVEFGCAGTLAKWAAAGADVQLLVLTDGSKGTWDPHADLGELVRRRRHEQEAAADVLGASRVHFAGFVDGDLGTGERERSLVCEVIRRVRPDVLVGHDPWKRYRLHPPHRRDRLLLFEPDAPDHFEDIEATMPAKQRALLCHRSQWRSTMGIDPDAPDADDELAAFAARLRDAARLAGERVGLAVAEEFKRIEPL